MKEKRIELGELRRYVKAAIEEDRELVHFYDRGFLADLGKEPELEDFVLNMCQKIATYQGVECYGVEDSTGPVGFFAYHPDSDLLISFGLTVRLRDLSKDFFEMVKKNIGNGFKCVIFSYNVRAIKWLVSNGMVVRADSITLLENQN